MTEHLIAIGNDLLARLLRGGAPQHMEPVLRDAWASLYRWRQAGAHVWRVKRVLPLAQDLDLAARPHHPGCCYQLPDRAQWIVLARHESGQPVGLGRGADPWGYPEAMITWCCDHAARGIESGCINLEKQPRWRDVWLTPGQSVDLDLSRQRALHADDLAGAEARLALALPWWLSPPDQNEKNEKPE